MSDQMMFDLDEPGQRARKSHPMTSHKASLKIKTGSVRHTILSAMMLIEWNEQTTTEIAKFLGRPRDSVSPHMKTLEGMGYIARTGRTRYNPATQTSSETWRLTEKYRALNIKPVYVKPRACPTCRRPL